MLKKLPPVEGGHKVQEEGEIEDETKKQQQERPTNMNSDSGKVSGEGGHEEPLPATAEKSSLKTDKPAEPKIWRRRHLAAAFVSFLVGLAVPSLIMRSANTQEHNRTAYCTSMEYSTYKDLIRYEITADLSLDGTTGASEKLTFDNFTRQGTTEFVFKSVLLLNRPFISHKATINYEGEITQHFKESNKLRSATSVSKPRIHYNIICEELEAIRKDLLSRVEEEKGVKKTWFMSYAPFVFITICIASMLPIVVGLLILVSVLMTVNDKSGQELAKEQKEKIVSNESTD